MSPPFITFPQLNFIIKKKGGGVITYQKSKTVVQSLTDFHNNQIAAGSNENGAWQMQTRSILYKNYGTGTFIIGHSNFNSSNMYSPSKIWRSIDNGTTWNIEAQLPVQYIEDINHFDGGHFTKVNYAIATCSSSSGGADIYRTTNSGQTWLRRHDGSQNTIYDHGTGITGDKIVVGGGSSWDDGVLRWSIDNGTWWNEQQPYPAYFRRLYPPTYAGILNGNEVWIAGAQTNGNSYKILMSNQTLDSTTNATWADSWDLISGHSDIYFISNTFDNYRQKFEWVGGNDVLCFSINADPIKIRMTSDYFVNVTVGQTLPNGLDNVRKLINFGGGKLWILCYHRFTDGSGIIYESTDNGVTWDVNNPIQSFPDMETPYDMTLNTNTGSVYVIGNYIDTHPTNPKRALLYEIS